MDQPEPSVQGGMKRGAVAPYAALIVLALIWGYNWVAIKIATNDSDAYFLSAARSVLGTVCLFGAVIATRRSLRPTRWFPTLVLGLLQTSAFTLLTVLAVAVSGAGKTAVLVYTMPFWVVLLAWPILHERVTRWGLAALALAAVGLALVLSPIDLGAKLPGEALAIGGAIAWAVSAVYGKVLRMRYTIDLLALTAWQMLWGSIPLVTIAAFLPHHAIHVTLPFILALAYIAIPGTGLAWLLWMFVLSRLKAGVAGVASLLTPVVGVASAWIQLGERPSSLELLGLACIVVALILNLIPERRKQPVPPGAARALS